MNRVVFSTVLQLGVLLAFFALALSAGKAASSKQVETPALVASLITAQDGVADKAMTISGGLYLQLKPGWKTYWRSPGEVGIPPSVEWVQSQNVDEVTFDWPAPKRFTAFGIENFGYEGEVVFPLQIKLKQPGAPAHLRAKVTLLVCSEVCVPETIELALFLPKGAGIDRPSGELIAQYSDKVPRDGKTSGFLEFGEAYIDAKLTKLVIELRSSVSLEKPDVFPELGRGATLGKPEFRLGDRNKTLWVKFPIYSASESLIQPPQITVTDAAIPAVSFSPKVVDIEPVPPFSVKELAPNLDKLIWMALLAFLGGLILNVMPCVLPVLSLKLSATLNQYGRHSLAVRGGFLAAAAGIMVFVWGLAFTLFVFKQLGFTVGWGIQFQNPVFLAFMALVLVVFAANFFGLFEIALPASLQTLLTNKGRGSGYSGDFLTGLFSAILATPCSAPFLGTAIAFALAGRGIDILIVFTGLGVGLAFPYFILAAVPGLVGMLPRPGGWMNVLKTVLGLLLVLTAIWILWILIGVAGSNAFLAVITLLTFLIALSSSKRVANWGKLAGGSLLAGLVLLSPVVVSGGDKVETLGVPILGWSEFDRGEIARLVSKGKLVFVDVTADWCVTCKANKVLVLEREPVLSALSSPEIVTMQADWTRPSEEISRYLAGYGRFGIPFNAIYGPGAPRGMVMSELLTSDEILNGLKAARRSSVRPLSTKSEDDANLQTSHVK